MTLSDSRPGRRLTTPLRPLPSRRMGLPRLPASPFRRAVPTTPADRAGACVDCFPARTAFPKWQEGRHPHCHAHSLLRLHSRYSPSDCSAALKRPLSRGSGPSGYPTKPLVSYQINRQLSGWNLPPLVIRAFGAHCQKLTFGTASKNDRESKRTLKAWTPRPTPRRPDMRLPNPIGAKFE